MEEGEQKLSENLEDYLEAISSLAEKCGTARLTDIAIALNVKKPSVTAALNALAERGLVEYEKYRPVSLTKDGQILADSVRKKHNLLSNFFTEILGVNASDADSAACKMEHSLEDGIMRKLIKFLKRIGSGSCYGCPKSSGSVCSCPNKAVNICASCGGLLLSQLGAGEKGVVLTVDNRSDNFSKLEKGGFLTGVVVEVSEVSPAGDSAVVKVGGVEVRLGKEYLCDIWVKKA